MTSYNHNGGPALDDTPEDVDRTGWIALHRGIRDHWLVGFYHNVQPADPDRGSACHFVAFVDLIMECRYREGYVLNGGRKMKIEPGQLVGAVSWLAHRWNWTPKKVRWFLEKLQEDGMIARSTVDIDGNLNKPQKGNHGGKQAAIITICNYAKYQVERMFKGQAKGHAEGKHGASKGQYYKEETKEQGKKIDIPAEPAKPELELQIVSATASKKRAPRKVLVLDENDPIDQAFAEFWKHYPATKHKTARPKALELFRTIVTTGTKSGLKANPETLVAAIKRYATKCGDPEYIPMPTTWLNDARWEEHAAAPPAKETIWWKDQRIIAAITDDRWRSGIRDHANGTWPVERLGPPPGHQDCAVPRRIVEELGLEDKYTPGGIKRGISCLKTN